MAIEVKTNKIFYEGEVIAEKIGAWELADVIRAVSDYGIRGKVEVSTTSGVELDSTNFPYDGDLIVKPVALAG